jgi:hypothetical protein
MKNRKSLWAVAICSAALLSTVTVTAADAKTYQVTGPVLEVTPTTITVQKGDDKWQIARDKGTKMSGEPKVGAKVTIYYRMVATEVDVKASEGASKNGDLQKKPAK